MDAIAGVLSDFQWWVGVMVASSNLNVSKGLKMIVRNEDGRMVVRVADFYNEYLQKISFDMDQTHFMCLVLIDSLFEQIELDDRREDHGIQFLNLWLGGERAFTKGEEYRMNASGIHSFRRGNTSSWRSLVCLNSKELNIGCPKLNLMNTLIMWAVQFQFLALTIKM